MVMMIEDTPSAFIMENNPVCRYCVLLDTYV